MDESVATEVNSWAETQDKLAKLEKRYLGLLQDFEALADALDCARSSMDVLARVAGLVQLERDVQDAVDAYRAGVKKDASVIFPLRDQVMALADARPRSKYSHVARTGQ